MAHYHKSQICLKGPSNVYSITTICPLNQKKEKLLFYYNNISYLMFLTLLQSHFFCVIGWIQHLFLAIKHLQRVRPHRCSAISVRDKSKY